MTTTSLPYLPVELIDNVIDIVINEQHGYGVYSRSPDSIPVLPSLALVSHSCRHRVNARRFSAVSVARKEENIWHGLADLMGSTTWTGYDAIAHNVTDVHIYLDQENFMDDDTLAKVFVDGTVTKVLNFVFRGNGANAAVKSSYRLKISGSNMRNGWGMTIVTGPNFNGMSPDLVQAIQNLCSGSLVTDIDLYNVFNVPRTLLFSPYATSLYLQKVHFSYVTVIAPPTNYGLQKLERLVLDYGSSSSFAAAMVQSPEVMMRNSAITLRYMLEHIDDLTVLSYLGKVATFRITIHPDLELGSTSIDWSAFIALRTLYIGYEFLAGHHPRRRQSRRPLFVDVLQTLPPVFPPSLFIQIIGGNGETRLSSRDALDEIHRSIHHPSLENFLENRVTSSVITLQMSFRIKSVDEDSHAYTCRLFSGLAAIKGLTLEIKVWTSQWS